MVFSDMVFFQSELKQPGKNDAIDDALLATADGDWQKAYSLWLNSSCLAAGTEDALHAYARTCEVLGYWPLHEQVISTALLRFPEDETFESRRLYRQAVQAMDDCRWQSAFQIFERLAEHAQPPWPYAYKLFRWLCFLQKKLEGVSSFEARMSILERWSCFKNTQIQCTQAAGLPIALALLQERHSIDEQFERALMQWVAVLKSTDELPTKVSFYDMPEKIKCLADALINNLHILELLPPSLSLFLGRFFLAHGYPLIYIRSRDVFISHLNSLRYQPDSSRPVELMFLMSLACEKGRVDDYRELLVQAERRELASMTCFRLAALYHTVPCRVDDWSGSPDDAHFADLVKGKSIAVVGPVDAGLDNGQEIDGFDLVIRFNHRESVTLDAKRQGARTDISYYIKDDLDRYDSSIYLKVMNNLRYVVLDQWSKAGHPWLDAVVAPKRQREVWEYGKSPYLVGSPNAIQRVLMDLSRFNPSCIKVFNATLFLNMDFAGGYKDRNIKIYDDFSMHDPVSNFVFLQKVRESGWVEYDQVLERILDMSVSEYLEKLFRFHGREW